MALPTQTMFLQVGQRRYLVASFEQASQMFCTARDQHGEGGSKTPSPLIVDEAGATIGYVSYNGRVWAGDPKVWTDAATPLYDNQGLSTSDLMLS